MIEICCDNILSTLRMKWYEPNKLCYKKKKQEGNVEMTLVLD
jgi:hypothetical protein